MNTKPKVGDHVLAAHDLHHFCTGATIKAGTRGVVVAVGPDAAVGWANVAFGNDAPGSALPVACWPGRDQAAVMVQLRPDGLPLCQEQVLALANGRGWTTSPCTFRARRLATDPQNPLGGTVPLCDVHANTSRWAGYPGIVWADL